jgi:hypothetical protein
MVSARLRVDHGFSFTTFYQETNPGIDPMPLEKSLRFASDWSSAARKT